MSTTKKSRSIGSVLKATLTHFSKSNTFQEGAALAYYSVFSILPMVMVATSVLGLIWGDQAVNGEIYDQLKGVLGSDAAEQVQDIIKNQHKHHRSGITAILGFLTLMLSASGMFNQLHTSFNNIWGITAKPKNGFVAYIYKHITSFSILITLFFTITLSVSIHGFLTRHSAAGHADLTSLLLLEHVVSFLLIALLFALMFRFLGSTQASWKVCVIAGLFTSVLFLVGKYLIGLYIGHSHLSSTFGSASLLALIMLWVYYTSQILFLGASMVHVLGDDKLLDT